MSLGSVVIIGGGQGGFQTAASLRDNGFAGRIVLVCGESILPYQRPPLSKGYLLGKVSLTSLLFRPETFFADKRIEIVTAQAVAIDRTNHRVFLTHGSPLPYDHLVLATGAHNRALVVEGAQLEGVFSLRTVGDADAIAAAVTDARDVIVVGAGFIGLEFAAIARILGKTVHVLDIADRPMARALSNDMSRMAYEAHAASGVRFVLGQSLLAIEGRAGRVAGVVTTDGREIPADMVMVGVGILPNVTLARDLGLPVANGIVVDAHLLTCDPAISAIGDCAAFPLPATGEMVRLESVQNATDQARAVAARLAGRPEPYAAVPWFWSDQGELKLRIAGWTVNRDTTVAVRDPLGHAGSALCFCRGKFIGVESLNRAADYMAARRILARGSVDLTPQQASEPGFELRRWEAATR